MLRSFRILLCACLLVAGMTRARAFSLIGPFEAWQVAGIGYNYLNTDIGGPHNIGEEYRWTTPNITYAFDSAFLNYYGTNGVRAIDEAFGIMNRLPQFSTLTADDLNSYPTGDTYRENGTAASLRLLDLKTTALGAILEELGLANPERWVFCLRQKLTTTNPNATNYTVVQRNFDPLTFAPSKYVNDIRYTYNIAEFLNPVTFADAIEAPADGSKPVPYNSIAGSTGGGGSENGGFGVYAIDLSRDDVGGLRYIYNNFNRNVEGTAVNGSVLVLTNFDAAEIVTTFDLTEFSIRSLTNNAAALTLLYPGLVITNTVQTLTSAVLVASVYITNLVQPGIPASALFGPIQATNFVNGFVQVYHHSYANVVTNLFSTNSVVEVRDSTFGLPPFAPASSPFVNSFVSRYVVTNIPSGRIFINAASANFANLTGYSFVDPSGVSFPVLTNILTLTNLVFTGTNLANGESFTRQTIITETNLVLAGFPITTNAVTAALRGGVDKLSFIRVHYDEANPQTYRFTNSYYIVAYTNGIATTQLVQQVQTSPDFLISAGDLGFPLNGSVPIPFTRTLVGGNWINNAGINGAGTALVGPGEITTPVVLTFSKIGPAYLNFFPFNSDLSEETSRKSYFFGSFDGSTNAPVLYPSELTLKDLESKLFPGR